MEVAQVSASVFDDWGCVLAGIGGEFPLLRTVGAHSRATRTAISLEKFVCLLEGIRATAADEGLSWNVGLAGDYARRGKLGHAVLGAGKLGIALRRLSDHYPLVQDATSLRLDVVGDRALLSYRILDPDIWPRHEDAMYSLGLYAGLIRCAAPAIWNDVEITVEQDRSRVPCDIASIVRTGVSYGGSANTIRFPVRALDTPLALAPPPGKELLDSLSRDLVNKRRGMPIETRARNQILMEMADGDLSQENIARILGVSSRTLRRKLAARGLSYQRLLDECRMRFVTFEFRRHKARPLLEIALALGYSEHSTFSRAFARWSGASPKHYRRRLTSPFH